ncbi:MAG: hypothetical protein C5S38_05145 [Candidatus Methanophagaceae archaeon]|nr:MAG: hypothetical protein C5S38_05145 [Methanophagales archaeon]KAF5430094.1 putative nuclease of the RNAse H fold, HicB family [Methanophagales archaeon]
MFSAGSAVNKYKNYLIHDILKINEVIEVTEYLISIKIEVLEEGGYLATSDTIQGFIAQGRTIAETMEIAQDVARRLIESYTEHGDPLPFEIERSSKKFVHEVKIPINVTVILSQKEELQFQIIPGLICQKEH